MSDYSAVSAYQQSAARGASPVGLIIALYDTLLRDFRRALAALDGANVETRVFELNHALTIIAHLRDVLDHERGGDAAARLSRFYEVTNAMIMEANVSGSRLTLQKLVEIYGGLRQAWEHAERHLASAPIPVPQNPAAAAPQPSLVRIPTTTSLANDPSESTVASSRWSA
jgi:flagellar protein FliS